LSNGSAAATNDLGDDIRVLRVADVAELRPPWDARLNRREIEQVTLRFPGLSVWNARTGEYLIAGPWRHRSEIATIVEVSGTSSTPDLYQAFIARAACEGMQLALVSEYSERRKAAFYSGVGMEPLEQIIVYEIGSLRPPRHRPLDLRFQQVTAGNPELMEALLDLDHRAFPWLWWNSRAELDQYLGSAGVSIWLALGQSGEPIAYVGVTLLRSWGHLDRIAVDPGLQGQGLGRKALDFAIATMVSQGARRAALSTQANNTVSRALYEKYGFRRTPTHDYRIYGRWLRDAERGEKEQLACG
jgi:ribosomal protein S18 acetylase RimI-like enzyme